MTLLRTRRLAGLLMLVVALVAVNGSVDAQGDRDEIRQWATSASATSQFGDDSWSAAQALGEPDTGECGDITTAWASASSTGIDALTVGFDELVFPQELNIYITYTPGAITSVELIDSATGDVYDVPNSADPPGNTPCPGVFSLDVSMIDERVDGAVIYVDQTITGNWNEIDAVELVGSSTPGPRPDGDGPAQAGGNRRDFVWEDDLAGLTIGTNLPEGWVATLTEDGAQFANSPEALDLLVASNDDDRFEPTGMQQGAIMLLATPDVLPFDSLQAAADFTAENLVIPAGDFPGAFESVTVGNFDALRFPVEFGSVESDGWYYVVALDEGFLIAGVAHAGGAVNSNSDENLEFIIANIRIGDVEQRPGDRGVRGPRPEGNMRQFVWNDEISGRSAGVNLPRGWVAELQNGAGTFASSPAALAAAAVATEDDPLTLSGDEQVVALLVLPPEALQLNDLDAVMDFTLENLGSEETEYGEVQSLTIAGLDTRRASVVGRTNDGWAYVIELDDVFVVAAASHSKDATNSNVDRNVEFILETLLLDDAVQGDFPPPGPESAQDTPADTQLVSVEDRGFSVTLPGDWATELSPDVYFANDEAVIQAAFSGEAIPEGGVLVNVVTEAELSDFFGVNADQPLQDVLVELLTLAEVEADVLEYELLNAPAVAAISLEFDFIVVMVDYNGSIVTYSIEPVDAIDAYEATLIDIFNSAVVE